MKRLDIRDIAAATGADFNGEGFITGVTTDSRIVQPGWLFVPIIGENMDGHQFIAQAFERGGAFALSSRRDIEHNSRVLFVEDTKRAHIAIGSLYLSMFNVKVVGVTGSVGKTTTKDFIAAVLSARYKVHKNMGNKNNEMGLPETVFMLEDSHEIAVLEMGMSGLGEIRDLSMSVRPHAGVITNIHGVHLEYLGSIENVKQAKLEIAEGMRPDSPLFLNGDDEMLRGVNLPGVRCLFFSTHDTACDITAGNIKDDGHSTSFDIHSVYGSASAVIPTTGAHILPDALAAFGVGCELGLTPGEAAAALSCYQPSGMRQRPVSFMGGVVMEDCYNASPVSMLGAITALKGMPCEGRRIAVFSDMLELGCESRERHLEVGRAAGKAGLDKLFAWGKDAKYYTEGAAGSGCADCRLFDSKQQLADTLRDTIKPGDIVWVKGSRGMKLEDMLACLYGGESGAN